MNSIATIMDRLVNGQVVQAGRPFSFDSEPCLSRPESALAIELPVGTLMR